MKESSDIRILIFRHERKVKLIRLSVFEELPATAITDILSGYEFIGMYEDEDNNFPSKWDK